MDYAKPGEATSDGPKLYDFRSLAIRRETYATSGNRADDADGDAGSSPERVHPAISLVNSITP